MQGSGAPEKSLGVPGAKFKVSLEQGSRVSGSKVHRFPGARFRVSLYQGSGVS
jgi:hypothetical protein